MATVELDALRAQIEILRFAKERIAELTELEKTARAAIEAAMGDADTGTLDGKVAIFWQHGKRTALNQKLLKEKFHDIWFECLETSPTRRFTIP